MRKGDVLVGGLVAAIFGFVGYQAAEVKKKAPQVPAEQEFLAAPIGVTASSSGTHGLHTGRVSDDEAIHGDLAVREALALNRHRTYMDNLLLQNDSVVRRWPTRTARAIRIWIADPTLVKGGQPYGRRFVRQAFDEWTMAGLPVRFEMVDDSATADVRVLWSETLPQKRVGVTKMAGIDNFFSHGFITIATHRPNGALLIPQHIASTVLHEVGHMLGLGHADDTSSVMFPEMSEEIRARRITPVDRATMRLLYRLPVGKVR